jgi:stearoyl-CoA desaturase (delta-9 desaturase)
MITSPWAPWVYVLVATHLTNACTTLYLHRAMAHGGMEIHPWLAVPMRIWIWLTTAVNTKEWVAIHRKHHSYTDREGDPHSPEVYGIGKVAFAGWWLYHLAARDQAMLEKYGKGTPDDWLERRILSRFTTGGPMLLGALNLVAFGWAMGTVVTLIQIAWMPVCGDVINGIGHFLGYRNTDTRDHSRNIVPWGVFMAGEELHNNHHADPRSPRFRMRWYELDVGWAYAKLLSWAGLVKFA